MIHHGQVCAMIVQHNGVVFMMEQIDQTIMKMLPDHHLMEGAL